MEFDLFGNSIAEPPANPARTKSVKPAKKPRKQTQAEVAAEKRRLSNNAAAVLARLQQGPATNIELAAVGGNRFGARIHELRQDGKDIKLVSKSGGITKYELMETK